MGLLSPTRRRRRRRRLPSENLFYEALRLKSWDRSRRAKGRKAAGRAAAEDGRQTGEEEAAMIN